MFLRIFELTIVFLILYHLVIQIVIPLRNKTPLFPAYRKEAEVKEEIVEKTSELHTEELLDQVDKLETKITEKKKRRMTK